MKLKFAHYRYLYIPDGKCYTFNSQKVNNITAHWTEPGQIFCLNTLCNAQLQKAAIFVGLELCHFLGINIPIISDYFLNRNMAQILALNLG